MGVTHALSGRGAGGADVDLQRAQVEGAERRREQVAGSISGPLQSLRIIQHDDFSNAAHEFFQSSWLLQKGVCSRPHRSSISQQLPETYLRKPCY